MFSAVAYRQDFSLGAAYRGAEGASRRRRRLLNSVPNINDWTVFVQHVGHHSVVQLVKVVDGHAAEYCQV